ncbi:MAG: hypothetical protein M1816_001672 [Peltula sp. TS41687]|nr:MAG: hypothetical protein M1816_001672 [Peltula sp. TS41687]
MSATTPSHTPSTSSGPIDPKTLTGPIAPFFPLTKNNLQDLLEYRATPYSQTSVISRFARPHGSHLCYITAYTPGSEATWSSVQTSETSHVELNSALVYMNHSCAPTVEIDVRAPDTHGRYPDGISGEVRVAHDRDLEVGDELTFFYPSTEWDSARPFKCLCGAGEGRCIGTQGGSKHLSKEVLDRYYLSQHIKALVGKRDADAK